MANTFLKRKWTLRRLWESYSEGLPVSAHLFILLLSMFVFVSSAPLQPGRERGLLERLQPFLHAACPGLFNPVAASAAMALALVTAASALRGLGCSVRASVLWALATAAGSLLLPLSSRQAQDALACACLLLLFRMSLTRREAPGKLSIVQAAVIVLCLLAAEPLMVLLLPSLSFFAWRKLSACGKDGDGAGPVFVSAALSLLFVGVYFFLVLPPALPGAVDCSPSSLLQRAWVLLAAPGRSLFLYSPVLLLAAMGWKDFRRLDPAAGGFVSAVALIGLVIVVLFSTLPGEPACSYEGFLPFIPVVSLPAVCAIHRRPRAVVAAVLLLGFAVQLSVLAGPPVLSGAAPVFDPRACPLALSLAALSGSPEAAGGMLVHADGGGKRPSFQSLAMRLLMLFSGLVSALVLFLRLREASARDLQPCPGSARRPAAAMPPWP